MRAYLFAALALSCVLAASAQAEFEPTPDERKAIAACLERVIGGLYRHRRRSLPQRPRRQHLHHRRLPYARAEDLGRLSEPMVWRGREASRRRARGADRVEGRRARLDCVQATPNAAIGRSSTRAARSLPSSPAIACGSKRGAARSKCARSSTTSITDRRKPVYAASSPLSAFAISARVSPMP